MAHLEIGNLSVRISKMQRAVFVVVPVFLSFSAALAQDIPRYDPEGWCKRVSAATGSESEWLFNGCIEQEQSNYDKLKLVWAGVPAKTRQWCDKVAKSGGRGSYVLLESCLDMEFFSKQQNDNKKFKF